ncbi:MAG: LysR family transcriptional regulator [Gammaproteobacteria bacterium]|nr:LysR family transcriptional regulator [Gammaproteobacteria bacterium]
MRLTRSPKLQSLRAFCVAARSRNFRVAADQICLTPSAVSHLIKDLEALLGVDLFERKRHSVVLTPAGQALLDELEPLLAALDSSLASVARRSHRRLRVRVPPFFATELFLPRLAAFCARYPDVDMQLESQESAGPPSHPPTTDVSIVLADVPPPGLRAERLFALTFTAACAREIAERAARLGSRVFDEIALITHPGQYQAWAEWAAAAGLDTTSPRHRFELDTIQGVVQAAEAGLGIALVPEPLCAARFESGVLVRIFPVEPPAAEACYVVCRPRDAERPEVAALLDWVVAEFRVESPAPARRGIDAHAEEISPAVKEDSLAP